MFNSKSRQNTLGSLAFEYLENKCLLAGDVAFAEPVDYAVFAQTARVVVADVNNDGTPDIMTSTWECCGNGNISLLLGGPDGVFSPRTPVEFRGPYFAAVDLNVDGYRDLVGARAANQQGVWVAMNEGVVEGTWGGFATPVRHEMPGPTQDVSAGDFDGDGDIDLAVGHSGSVPVLLNQGTDDGQWLGFAPQVDYTAGSHSSTVVNGDVDGDGDLDLVVGNMGGNVSVLRGYGDGTFSDAVHYPVGANARGVRITDLDGDGDLDAAVPIFNTPEVAILTNNGDGTFADATVHLMSRNRKIFSLEPADVDRDGDADLVVNAEVRLLLLLNNGDGTFEEHTSSLIPTTRVIQDHAVFDLDFDGDQDVVSTMAFGDTPSVNVFWNETPPNLLGDLNNDLAVDGADAGILFANWGASGEGDLNDDGMVDAADAGLLFENWTGDTVRADVSELPIPWDVADRKSKLSPKSSRDHWDEAMSDDDSWLPLPHILNE